MGNDIDLICTGLLQCFVDRLCDGSGIFFYGSPGFLMSIIDAGAILLQDPRNTSPVIKIFQIAESNTMHHDKRIFCLAGIGRGTQLCVLPSGDCNGIFIFDSPAHSMGKKQIDHGDPEVETDQNPLYNAEPPAGADHTDATIQQKQQDKYACVNNIKRKEQRSRKADAIVKPVEQRR